MLFKLFPCHCLAVIEPCVAITEVPSLFWLQATISNNSWAQLTLWGLKVDYV